MRYKFVIVTLIISIRLIGLEVSGRIVTTDGKPIENVIVTVNDRAEISDKFGTFSLNELQYKDQVNFHKISYKDRKMPAGEIPLTVVLEVETITIQGLRVLDKRKKELIGSGEVIVIKPDENAGSVADILRDNYNLQVTGIPLTGEEQKVVFPGYKARHTLVMLDGIPLNKGGTAFDISTIPAEIIESIEIVKGSSSSIGGAGSMGGIININTTMSSHKYLVYADHRCGSFGLDAHSIKFSTGNSKLQLSAFFRKVYARNDFKYLPADDPDTLRIRTHNEKSFYDAILNLNYSNSIGIFSYKFLFQDFFNKLPGNTESLEFYKNSRITGQSQKHIVNYSRKIKDYMILADAFYSLDHSLYDNTRLDWPWNTYKIYATLAENDQVSRGMKLHAEYFSEDFYFDWGVDYRYEDFNYTDLNYSEQSIGKVFRHNYAVFAKTLLEKKHFPYQTSLNGSLRLDRTTDFDDNTSWKLGPEFSYENFFKISFGGNVANGYTLPSYYSLFWKGDTYVSGNPDLIPESSISWQIFSKIVSNGNLLQVTYRHDDIDNMILWFIDSFGKWKPINLSSAEVVNWDFELNMQPLSFLKLTTNYTNTSAINKSKNDPNYNKELIYIPKYILNINSRIDHLNYYTSISYTLTGEQWSVPDQSTSEHLLPAYDLINAEIGYSFKLKQFEFNPVIKVNNLLDNLYEVYDHIPQPGLNWEVNLNIEWKI